MAKTKHIGMFKNDIFPYIIIHTIVGWDDCGDPQINIGYPNPITLKASGLIAVFPFSKKDELEKEVSELKSKYEKELKIIGKSLLDSFCQKYPVIREFASTIK